MIIKLYAWIPRSYVHVAEILSKLNTGLRVPISKVEHNDYVSFIVNEFEGYKNISFVLDGEGLYSVSIKVPEGSVEKAARDFYNIGRRLIMELIKSFHNVTYRQIIEGILPINYATITLSNREHPVKDYEKSRTSGLTIYSKSEAYMKDTFTYISGRINSSVESLCDYLAFTNIISHFMYEMMNKMEEYHKGTKEVIRLLEYEPKSKMINAAYLNLDLVKKDAAESWAKIEQGIDCLYRKKKNFENTRFSTSLKGFVEKLGVRSNFEKLNADKDYVHSLWSLLINHLEYVDTAVEARVNYKSMNAYRANQWLSIVNSGFILGAILLAMFMISTGQLNNIQNFIILIVAWILSYEVINYFILRRKS